MTEERLTHVIYIAGAGRSGSTLLSNLLGQLPGAVNVGELYYLWERGLRDNILCGCGTPVRECPFWVSVLRRTEQAMGVDNLEPLLAAGVQGARTRYLVLMSTAAGRRRFVTRSQPFVHVLRHLYRAIRDETGCRWIVDASKFPTYGYLLTRTPGLQVSVVHLIRDARAVAFSWQRRKPSPDSGGELFGRMSTSRSALIWDTWNVGAELLGRLQPSGAYCRLRYEHFIQDAAGELGNIITMSDLQTGAENVVRDGVVTMRQAHTIGGNPVRFEKTMTLRLDSEWKRAMPPAQRRLTTLLTYPLLRRYHYGRHGSQEQ